MKVFNSEGESPNKKMKRERKFHYQSMSYDKKFGNYKMSNVKELGNCIKLS